MLRREEYCMKKIVILTLVILLCSFSVAFGYVVGSSNLPLSEYPDFDRYRYKKPSTPYSRNQYYDSRYRAEVENYVQDAKNYVEAANNDIQRIIEAKQEAIASANEAINEYNSYARGY